MSPLGQPNKTPFTRTNSRREMREAMSDSNGFIARSKKAVAGAITGAAIAIGAQLPGAIADGVFTVPEFWTVFTFTVGGAVIGFAGVWAAPANASESN